MIALNELYLFDNPLGGSLPSELFDSASKLQRLDLSRCLLTGQIPTQIGHLKNLERLELGENIFNGTIPSEIGELDWLDHLELSYNVLTGNVPSEIGLLASKLEDLDLGECARIEHMAASSFLYARPAAN